MAEMKPVEETVDERGPGGPVGAVMVVGGGIGGIQASLDLVEMGYRVYLVDSGPSIGGVMSQLDKTFPTNDCSTCILSPKLVEVGTNENIELYTLSDVVGVEGEEGDFTVELRVRPRFVDPDRCTGCGICEKACPNGTISVLTTQNLAGNKMLGRYLYRFSQCTLCNLCVESCPFGAITMGQDFELAKYDRQLLTYILNKT